MIRNLPRARPRDKKSFRFQLAPLVDLLLIVVFAQFIEVRETTRQNELARQQTVAAEQRNRRDAQVELAEIRRTVAMLKRQQRERERRIGQAAATLATAFDLDARTRRLLPTLSGDANEPPSPAIETLADQIASSPPEDVVRFLIGHAELLKRAEIWHLHADPNRRLLLQAGSQSAVTRLERRGQDARTDETADWLFTTYKQLPQPKGLVVILASYSPRAVAGVYQPMVDALPRAVERMRFDLPATRFEFTILGSTPLPEVLRGVDPVSETAPVMRPEVSPGEGREADPRRDTKTDTEIP